MLNRHWETALYPWRTCSLSLWPANLPAVPDEASPGCRVDRRLTAVYEAVSVQSFLYVSGLHPRCFDGGLKVLKLMFLGMW